MSVSVSSDELIPIRLNEVDQDTSVTWLKLGTIPAVGCVDGYSVDGYSVDRRVVGQVVGSKEGRIDGYSVDRIDG